MTCPSLSVCMITQNMAHVLPLVLSNVEPVADEIVVVDGGSKDHTAQVMKAHPKVRLLERAFDGRIADQKNFALDAARGDWILLLDSDELLGDRLRARIPRLIETRRYTHYKIARYWVLSGPPWTYVRASILYPDFQLRLFRNLPVFRYTSDSVIHHRFPREGRGRGKKLRRLHLFHFDFVLADRRTREAKVRRYLSIEPGSASTSKMYLFEDLDYRERACREPLSGIRYPGLAPSVRQNP